jgi:outer membrane protein assembly factor BamB
MASSFTRTLTSSRYFATLTSLGITLLSAPTLADNWPQWRGPAATGVSSESPLPESWSETQNIAWKARLKGVGVSSPIVWGDRVYATSQLGRGTSQQGPRLGQGGDASPAERSLAEGQASRDRRMTFLIEAFQRATGAAAWTFELSAEGDLPPVHDKHNLASSSPVTDGERVYAVFGTGQVVAVDSSGKQAWSRNLAQEYGPFDINWGHGSSPTIHKNVLYLVCYHPSAAYLLALDARTGRQLWKVDRPSGVTSYSTPIIVPSGKGEELVVNSSVGLEAYDPLTGRALWHLDESNQFPIPVASFSGGVIYLSRGYRSGPYAAIRPGGEGDVSKTHVVWHVPTGAPYISSLVHYDGLLYMAGDTGVITCVDAKTGQTVWRERLGGIYTASPVGGDGKIFLMAESGETIVLRAGRSPQVLARNRIDGRVLASPAISAGRLFVRTDDALVAIGR